MNGKALGSWKSLVGMEAQARKVAPFPKEWWQSQKAWTPWNWSEKRDQFETTRKLKSEI